MNILIITPHPDDEVLGCGGAILKQVAAGDTVYLCIMTKGDETYYGAQMLQEKRTEVLNTAKFLGIAEVFFLDFTAAHLDTYPQNQINQKLREIIQKIKPEILFIPHQGDLHRDHQITHQCAMVAAKPILNSFIKKIIAYESLSETEQSSPYSNNFHPNFYVNITTQLARKIQALAIYQSELRDYPHPRSLRAVEYKARSRGVEVGVDAAESFMILKEIQ